MSRCGYTVTDRDGIEEPCGEPATGWRWYQDVEHEDMLDAACSFHANEGGRRLAAAEARIAELGSEPRTEYRRKYGNSLAWHISYVGPFAEPSSCLQMRVIDEYRIVGEWCATPAGPGKP